MTRRFDNLGAFARLVAAVCALALVFGDAARDVHLLFAEHVVCAAHGELVEASEARGVALRDVGSRTALEPGVDTSEEHEHCRAQGTAVAGPSLTLLGPPRIVVAAGEPSAVLALPSGETRSESVLELAPKQGPPS